MTPSRQFLLCLAFAILTQIAANFGNEYYDFKTWHDLKKSTGSAINPLLGKTAMNLLIFALLFADVCLLN